MRETVMERKLTAILAADVVGYSRLMEADEAGTLAALKSHCYSEAETELWRTQQLLRSVQTPFAPSWPVHQTGRALRISPGSVWRVH